MKRLAAAVLTLAVAAGAASAATAKAPFGAVYVTTVKGLKGQAAPLNGTWAISFSASGGYAVLKKPSTTKLIVGTSTVSGKKIVFRDSSGPLACQGGTRGTYNWSLSGKTLRLGIVKDPCPGRPLILAGGPFTKVS